MTKVTVYGVGKTGSTTAFVLANSGKFDEINLYEQLKERLDCFKIPYDILSMGAKCMGFAYLDDRAVNVSGKRKYWESRFANLLYGNEDSKDGKKK